MLAQTRFVAHFDFIGNFDKHYGIFEGYGAASPFEADAAEASCC
jgi:arsenite methyltransferase